MVSTSRLAALGVGAGLDRAIATGQEVASVSLSIPILIFATLTLRYTVPQQARIEVDHLSEAEFTDLIFFIYPQPIHPGSNRNRSTICFSSTLLCRRKRRRPKSGGVGDPT